MDMESPEREYQRIMTDEEAAQRADRRRAAREARRRKRRRRRIIKNTLLIVLAAVLVTAAAAAGFLLYLQKCAGAYDDITECAQSQPMDCASRFSFSPEDKSVSMKLDKNDIWWLLYQTGAVDRLEKLEKTLAGRGLRLTGMGIDVSGGDALNVSLEITCPGGIRVPLTASCAVSYDGSDIIISAAEARLCGRWELPLRRLCALFGSDPSALCVKIGRDIHPFLADIRSIAVTGGSAVLTYGADKALILRADGPMAAQCARLGAENPALAAVLEAASGSGSAALEQALASFAADPGAYVKFRTGALALADETACAEYLTGAYAPYTRRFMPELTAESVSSVRQELLGTISGRTALISTLAENLNDAYAAGKVLDPSAAEPADGSREGGENPPPAASFVNASIEGRPALAMEQLAAGNWASYSQWITEGDMRAVYLSGFADTTVEVAAPAEPGKKAGEEEEAKPTVTTPARPIGLLVRMGDGSFTLFYHLASLADAASVNVTYTPASAELDAASGESYMSAAVIPTVVYSPDMPLVLLLSACSPAEKEPDNHQNDLTLSEDTGLWAEKLLDDKQITPNNTLAMNRLKAAMIGDDDFFEIGLERRLNIKDLRNVVSSDNAVTTKVKKFTVIDLDADSIDEIVLWLSVNGDDYYGFEILRYYDEEVYGYLMWYRAFNSLKEDGTFSFSSGAADSGFGKLKFNGKTCNTENIAYSESDYDSNNEISVSFFYNGKKVAQGLFETEIQKQNKKKDSVWYDFTVGTLGSSWEL